MPERLDGLSDSEAAELCRRLRVRLIDTVSRTGGHLASSLGAVELIVAIHRVFDTGRDRLVFDVGHQCYAHKILTGRNAAMETLRTFGGIAGFPKPGESGSDAFIAGHASNSVSVALGMARARTLQKENYHVLALIGDGALTGGLAYEGLSDAGDSGEPLKYEAAKYLIGNMGGNAAMDGPSLDRYYRLLDGFYSRPDIDIFALREFNDSLFASPFFTDLKPVFDARTLDSAYLVSHIDRAFEAWESPWAKDLDFNEFCEFLLPYRIGTEIIEDWRTDYRNHYAPYLDRLARRSDAPLEEFCEALNSACVEPHLYENYPGGKPSLKPSVLKRIVGGSCDDYVGLFTYAARTFGVPVAIDFTPQWGNHSQGHKWCATIENDTTYVFDIGDILRPAASNPFTYRLVKAYRKSWAYQSGSPAGHEAPPSLSDQRLVDVTAMYCPVVDIDIRDLQEPLRSRMVWLCAFDDRQ